MRRKPVKRPDLILVLIGIFGLGVLITGVSASQHKAVEIPVAGQMPGVLTEADVQWPIYLPAK